MKKPENPLPILTGLVAAALSVCLLTGCESSDDDDGSGTGGLKISPNSASFASSNATSILFTSSGGTPDYSWSVDDAALGSVSASGDSAIYTSTTNTGVNFLMVTDAASNAVSATITQN